MMSNVDSPTRPDDRVAPAEADAEWEAWIRQVHEDAVAAWKTGRRLYQATFVWAAPGIKWAYLSEDAAGAIETIEDAGWRLDHVGYVNANKMGQAGGALDSAQERVRCFYLFRRPSNELSA